MRSSRLSKLILAFILFLFTITITGVHAWAPVLLENIEHQHELSIVVEDDASSHWSLQHSSDSLKNSTDHDAEAHSWKNIEVVFKKLCHFLKLLKTGMMHYGNYI